MRMKGELVMLDLIYFLLSGLLFFFIFFKILNTGIIYRLFVPLQKKIKSFKNHELYGKVSFIALIFLCQFVRQHYNLNNITTGLLCGFLFSLHQRIFE